MTSKLPEIRINFSRLLYESVSKPLAKADNIKLHQPEEMISWVEDYRMTWHPLETQILTGMQNCYGLQFYKSVIDVYVAPWIRAMSSPLIMNFKYDTDKFIDVLTHELCHVLLNDNTLIKNPRKLGQIYSQLYPDEDLLTRNHIWIHAGLKYIFLDVLGSPSRLERDIQDHQDSPGYKRAWEIVERDGYKELITQLQQHFDTLR